MKYHELLPKKIHHHISIETEHTHINGYWYAYPTLLKEHCPTCTEVRVKKNALEVVLPTTYFENMHWSYSHPF